MSQPLKFLCENRRSRKIREDRSIPGLGDTIHKPWHVKPEVFKPKSSGHRNGSVNGHHTRHMIRSSFGQWINHRVRVVRNPISSSEEPIELLKEGVLLHVGPSEATTFQWQFQKTQV